MLTTLSSAFSRSRRSSTVGSRRHTMSTADTSSRAQSLGYSSSSQSRALAKPNNPSSSTDGRSSGGGRGGGLLGRVFRKGQSRNPSKLKPVGISSKDFFTSSNNSNSSITKSAKLTRKLSTITPRPEATNDADVDPVANTTRTHRFSNKQLSEKIPLPVIPPHSFEDPSLNSARENGRRGSLWRSKLSFSHHRQSSQSARLPRRERHQSFDGMAAVTSNLDQSTNQFLRSEAPPPHISAAEDHRQYNLESFLNLADDGFEEPHPSRRPAASTTTTKLPTTETTQDDDNELGYSERDFLLSIQCNTALEARRHRRRETRRKTMSFLSSPDPAQSASSLSTAPPGVAATTFQKHQTVGYHSSPQHPATTQVHQNLNRNDDISQPVASFSSSSDSLTYSEHAVTSINDSSDHGNIKRGSRANGAHRPPPILLDLDFPVHSNRHPLSSQTLAMTSSQEVPPPVPPLPSQFASTTPSSLRSDTATETLHCEPIIQTADTTKQYRMSGSALLASEITKSSTPSRKAHPLSTQATPHSISNDDVQKSSERAMLQQYSMSRPSANSASISTVLQQDKYPTMQISRSTSEWAMLGRKFSHPDPQLPQDILPQQHSLAMATPSPPGAISKSISNLNMRMSVDSSKSIARKEGVSMRHAGKAHGIGRLFSSSSSETKQAAKKTKESESPKPSINHLHKQCHQQTPPTPQDLTPPTSPTVSSLVGDPSARRKIRDQLASSLAFDRLLEEDDEFTMAISLTPTVAGMPQPSSSEKPRRCN